MPKPKTKLALNPRPLSPKQLRFVSEYLVDLNATQSVIRAGYSDKGASVQGFHLLANPKIQAEIASRGGTAVSKTGITPEKVLLELGRLAFSDIRVLFDENGNLKPVKDLTDDQAAMLASVEVVRQNLTSGDGTQEWVHKVKSWDKLKALEMLARHLKLLNENSKEADGRPINFTLFIGVKTGDSGTKIEALSANVNKTSE